MADEQIYDDWLARCRSVSPPPDLTDCVMNSVEERANRPRNVLLAERMNASLSTRLAACLAALLVGSLPFLFVAYVAQSLVF